MTLTLDKTSVKAGEAVFMVHNDAVSEDHEMVLVKLKSPDEAIPLNTAKHRIGKKKLKALAKWRI